MSARELIEPGDRRFSDSPDVGPNCPCSRCGWPITHGVPVRAYGPEPFSEYRYHAACLDFPVGDEENHHARS